MKSVKCITINTDASWHPQQKVGGYAFHIVCNDFRIKKSGMFKSKPNSSMDAEMMCMANAIATLLAQKELPGVNLIIINSDALFTFQRIGLNKKDEIGRKVAQLLRQLRKRMSIMESVLPKFEFRHVKAHSGKNDSRSIVNEWCDQEAKKWMRKQLNINQ